MPGMRSRRAALSLWLGFSVCGAAQATSCGETVRVENHADLPVTVLIKSFYGTDFERPDPGDFTPEATWRPGTMPFIRVYEVPLEPGAASDVFVRTLCDTPGRRHWVNWSYSVDGDAPVSGQTDLTRESARVLVQPAERKTSG